MDDAGNILIRRYSKSSVFVKSTAATSNEETAIGQDILKLPGYALEQEKIFKVSDLYILSMTFGKSSSSVQGTKSLYQETQLLFNFFYILRCTLRYYGFIFCFTSNTLL